MQNIRSFLAKFFNTMTQVRALLIVILLVQIAMFYFYVKPIDGLNNLNLINVFNEVSAIVAVPPAEVPTVGVVGDSKNLPDIESIKAADPFSAEVYKNAQNGDYALLYTSKLVIYRRSTCQIIYEGPSPSKAAQDYQTIVGQEIREQLKERGLLAADSEEVPELLIVSKKEDLTDFYADAEIGDVGALFTGAQVIAIYRPSTQTLVKTGTITTQIQ